MRVDSPKSGYGPSRVAPQKRTAGFQSRRSETSFSPGAGASRSSSAATLERGPIPLCRAEMRDVDRPFVPDVAQRPYRGGRDSRIRIGKHKPNEAWHRRMVRLLESGEGPDPAPLSPFRARASAHTADEPLGLTCSELARVRFTPPMLVARASEHGDQRQQDPRGKRKSEHDHGNAEDERVHPHVVVVRDACAVPRSRDPRGSDHVARISWSDADERT